MTEKINKEEVEILPLFSTLIVKINIGRNFTEDELQFLLTDLPMLKDEHRRMTHHQSESFNIFDNYAIELKDIKTFCEHELKRYLEEIEGVDTDRATLEITASWLNEIPPQGFHPLHNQLL